MAEERGDGFEAHAAIDGLGRESVAELVRVDPADAGVVRDPADHAADAVAVDGGDVVGEESSGACDVVRVAGLPVGDQVDECRVERDVAVVAELADGDVQGVMVADLDNGICGQVAEFADAHAGACQEQHTEFAERVGFGLGVVHERCHLVVIEKLWEWFGAGWDVAVDDRVAAWCVVELPVDDPVEEHLHHSQALADRVRRQRLTSGEVDVGDALEFERLDVRPIDVGGAANRRVVGDDPDTEPDEGVGDRHD